MPGKLAISDNKRFLVTTTGAPFFWLADTAWEMVHRGTREDIQQYLDNRQRLGFNVVQTVILAERGGLRIPNAYGHLPLINNDPAQPVEAYFEHVDWVLDALAQRDMVAGLLPTWGDKVHPKWGEGPIIFTEDNARTYGEYVGRRYADRENVVWILGGDRPAVDAEEGGKDFRPIWRAMAAGIKSGGSDQLMGYHPRGFDRTSPTLHHEDWLDFNAIQSSHSKPDQPSWTFIEEDYALEPVKPTIEMESCYEDIPVDFKPDNRRFNAYDVRKQAYRPVFAGGFGYTYGHNSIWAWYIPGDESMDDVTDFWNMPWQDAIERPGGAQMQHLRNLIESRPFLSRIPDQSLVLSDIGEGGTHIRATRDSDGTYAMIYVPDANRSVTVDLHKISGDTFRVWTYDPRTGEASEIGTVSGDSITLTTPAGGPDWVLVIDDARQGFSAPGQA